MNRRFKVPSADIAHVKLAEELAEQIPSTRRYASAVFAGCCFLVLGGCQAVSTPHTATLPAIPRSASTGATSDLFTTVHVELGPIVPISSESGELISRVAASDPVPAGQSTNSMTEPIIEQSRSAFDSLHELEFRDDIRDLWPRLRDDAKGLANWNNAVILGAALGGSLAMRPELDNDVREFVADHPKRWDRGSEMLGWLGDATVQVPILMGAYAYSLNQQNEESHDLMNTLISAYILNGAATVTIKAIANTDRPSAEWNGGKFGFPSFHTSSSFTIAAVLDEYEGHRVGLPAYVLAGLIGWSRIDEQDHDLSDVVFGAAMGYVIGKSVAGRHLDGDSRVRILPYTHPTDGASGLMLDIAY